jgi:mono/diheme cytochrome c family protein
MLPGHLGPADRMTIRDIRMKFSTKKLAIVTASLCAAVLLSSSVVGFQPPAKDGAEETATDGLLAGADLDRGKVVFERVGLCISCHGWDGNGMGKNPRSEGAAAKLRETQLDTEGLMDIIRCGIPSTPMPYHDSQAYRKPEVCYGMTMADFEPGEEPRKGKTFREKDLVNLVAYIQHAIAGKGETTLADCEAFFGGGAKNCDALR